MKKIIASVLVISMLSTTGAICMAENEFQSVKIAASKEEVAGLGEEAKQELEDLNKAITEVPKEENRTKIKNWIKENWIVVWEVCLSTFAILCALALMGLLTWKVYHS